MKPKTKIQIRVDKLSRKLPALKPVHKKWAAEKLFDHYTFRTLRKNTCLECGHAWPVNDRIPLDHIMEETCPKCGTILQTLRNKKRTHSSVSVFYIATVIEEFQVLRYFNASRKVKVGSKRTLDFMEICQHWIRSDGRHVVRSVSGNPLVNLTLNKWCNGYPMEVRRNKDNYYFKGPSYPERKYLKVLSRNGFRGKFHGLHPAFFFPEILSNPIAETLLKARQYPLLQELASYYGYKVKNNWPSIKICMRNNYLVKDAGMWFDHMELLRYFHKDLNNPFYVCPVDLSKKHDKLVKRKARIEKMAALEEQRKQIAAANIKFKKEKAKYFGIRLMKGGISIVVLDDVNEYVAEGEALHHCVYVSRYHERKGSLILSARKDGKRIATIEFSLEKMSVLQIRGNHNSVPPHYSLLKKLVEDNVSLFKQARNAPKKHPASIIQMNQNVEQLIAV